MKPLTFSYSKIKNFRTCPRRHQFVDVLKEFKEEESEALQWGNSFHTAMEKRLLKGDRLPLTMLRYEGEAQFIEGLTKDRDAELKVEQKLAFDKEFRATSYFDNGAWFRSRIDVAVIYNDGTNQATLFDWKTGAPKEDEQQLALSAQAVFAHYPNIDYVSTSYVWIGAGVSTKTYTRRDMPSLWSALLPEIRMMEMAHNTNVYPAKPSGICVKFCPVKSCEYWGKGSR